MTAPNVDGIRQQAHALLAAEDTDPWQIRACIPKLTESEDRLLAAQLFERLRQLALSRAQALAWETNPEVTEVLRLNDLLKTVFEFGKSRTLLKAAAGRSSTDEKSRIKLNQQLALCTYKDEELTPDYRFSEALRVLESPLLDLRNPACSNPETLGLGGAIYKRRWEYGGQPEDLETALHFYRLGWQRNAPCDMGYCGVNAALAMDLLGERWRAWASRENTDCGGAERWFAQARALREEIRDRIPEFPENWTGEKESYWYYATLAEVHWGLGEWAAASTCLARARTADHDEWTLQSTARQLVTLAQIHGVVPPGDAPAVDARWSEALAALTELLGDDARAAFDCRRGKVGLALSGGGFRASLYHLGVLARMAECDMLRSVEVLSTVSGGSIVGAHYYLALRDRLQNQLDGELSREQYIAMVGEVIEQFFAGVQKNLRVRALANLISNLRMLGRTYSRSNRMGELYEKHLYAQVRDGHKPKAQRKLRDLLIQPRVGTQAGTGSPVRDKTFKPKFSNWRRLAKVPTLLLNATSLNSGHNWHFTASWMGEPPGLTGQEIDMNERYRRLYYRQAPTPQLRDYPLGYAVAASAGVPALFDPLVLRGLYPGRTVKLVDGGVHDNQGIAGLLDEGCTLLLCSDASGQMNDEDAPAGNLLAVFLRADGILQDRLREAQYQDLAARERSHALQGLFFVHLKQELESDPIDWTSCQDPGQPGCRRSCTSYGVDRTIQKLLSEIRTDLDSFTEVEACALMASGYLMTDRELRRLDGQQRQAGLPGQWAGFDVAAARRVHWPFVPMLPIVAADPMGSDRRARDLATQLSVSRTLFGKVWQLIPWLRNTALALALALLLWGVLWVRDHWYTEFTLPQSYAVGQVATALAFAALTIALPLARFFQPLAIARKWLFMGLAATFGCLLAHLHLLVFDPLFKRRGRLKRLLKLPGG